MGPGSKPKREFGETSRKVITIVALSLLLVLPLKQVESQIEDRHSYESNAQDEVAKGWGTAVLFTTPILFTHGSSVISSTSDTEITMDSQEKKRGVFKVPVYLATLKSKITFSKPGWIIDSIERRRILANYMQIVLEPVSAVQNFKVKDAKTGKELKARLNDVGVRVYAEDIPDGNFFDRPFEFEITMRGTGSMKYQSNSDKDNVIVKGNWKKPKFLETIFPDESILNRDGFHANWVLNSLPVSPSRERNIKSVGLNHLWIATDYAKIERSVKYGTLFIALTFLLVFAVEFMTGMKIHPLQYGLIGLSISIFYLLLLAISEVLGFDYAYLVSSIAVTSLIVFYVNGFIKNGRFTKMIFGEQITLNIFFYVLLSMEERAFLMGSLGLFGALAGFMILTRKIDWYGESLIDSKSI